MSNCLKVVGLFLKFVPCSTHLCMWELQNLWVTIYNFIYKYINNEGFPGDLVIKNPPAIQETQAMWFRSLCWEDPLEEGMGTHSSIFAWRIPWTEEPGGLQSMWSQRAGHDWSDLACLHINNDSFGEHGPAGVLLALSLCSTTWEVPTGNVCEHQHVLWTDGLPSCSHLHSAWSQLNLKAYLLRSPSLRLGVEFWLRASEDTLVLNHPLRKAVSYSGAVSHVGWNRIHCSA